MADAAQSSGSAPQLQPIAIVGMSCRLPGGVSSPGDFWKMLCRARSGWSKIPEDRFNAAAYNHPNPDKKGCFNSQGGYFLKDDISMFDAGFFDITKKEAESMDPAQRLILECTYEALENAGIPKESVAGRKVGVFVGGNYNEHRTSNLRDLDHMPAFDATGNQGAFLAGRLAYYFNLRGPTFTVDTACSSSMHALHLAVQSIRSGESEQAIVAASHLITQPDIWVSMAKLRLFSEAGRTYAFDNRAKSGYARGEGAGCLVLKPLDQAIADNDHIRAVINHTGISHNGRTVGIVAPSPEEQEQLLRDVFAQAGIDPREVGFFEAHGTGTKKGDPIEATAIYKAVGQHFTADQPLYIGSTKPNVGHLECASGLVSVIKSVLMLYYGFVLPNAEFQTENEAIPLAKWNMKVPLMQRPWPSRRKYACVNNFGFSGSNAHAVLAAAPTARTLELSNDATYQALRLFVISANDEAALKQSMNRLGIFLEQHAELYQSTMPRNLAYTLCQRRSHLPWRVALVTGMCSGLATALNGADVVPMRAPADVPKLAFVFTGQGAQWWGMGRELLASHPVFSEAIDRADAALRDIGADFSILEELTRDENESKVALAHISQPICSAVQLALTDLLASFGIRPSSVTGHSSGEIGAAYAAGALTFEGAMHAAYHRGQAIVELKRQYADLKGSMMAVGAGADTLDNLLAPLADGQKAVVACENSPSSTTLSGDEAAIDAIGKVFQEKGTFNRKLFVDVAYHSHHMKLISDYYLDKVAHIQPGEDMERSHVQFFSSLKGRRVELSELGPQYWVDNLTQAVRFSTSLQVLCNEAKPDVLVEIGPHAALKGPIMQILKKLGAAATKISYIPVLVRGKDATRTALELAGQLFQRGYSLDFHSVNHKRREAEKPDLIPSLFSYPWTRQRYWYESRISQMHRLKPFARHDLLGTMADWSNELEPTWRNIVRLEDLPWLRDYQVQGRIMFPVAGFVSMLVEAAAQRAVTKGVEAGSYDIRDLHIADQLEVEDGAEVEVLLTLRPNAAGSDGPEEFRISSHEPKRGWLEHCRGTLKAEPRKVSHHGHRALAIDTVKTEAMVRFQHTPDFALSSTMTDSASVTSDSASVGSKVPSSASSDAGVETNFGSETPATECHGQGVCDKLDMSGAKEGVQPMSASATRFYEGLASAGHAFPKSFQSLVQVAFNENEASAHCCIQDTASDMPNEHETSYKIHPTVVDVMLQLPLSSLSSVHADCAHLPSAIQQVHVSASWRKKQGEGFHVQSTREAKTGGFVVEAYSTQATESASVSIMGVQYTAMKNTANEVADPRELCFKMEWEPVGDRPIESSEGEAQAQAPTAAKKTVIVSESEKAEKDGLVVAVSQAIELQTGARPEVSSLRKIADFNSNFVVLSELERPMLSSITAAGFEQVKRLLSESAGLLWVTRGAAKVPTNPNANMALGLVRTARSEREAIAATLDLDPNSKLDTASQASMIQDAFSRAVLAGQAGADMEFAEDKGRLVTARLAVDERMNLDLHRELGPSAPYMQHLHQPGRQLQLSVQTEGSYEDIFFEDRPVRELMSDEIEILVAASAITRDDTLPKDRLAGSMTRGCSGFVTRLGSNARKFAIGDRVCALAEGPLSSHVRVKATSASKITEKLSIETAASIPASFCAAYYALADICHVSAGEHVLVQLSGPIGLAAMEVARHYRANTFALVQSDAEKVAARKLGVSNDHILDGRSIYLRRLVEEGTQGHGLDVIITSSNDAVNVWDCLADFGHFVEIRTSAPDSLVASRPRLGANATFSSVNMASLANARPKAVEKTLQALMERFTHGALTQRAEPVAFPIGEVAKGLQMVHDGAIFPVVVTAGGGEQVKAVHRRLNNIFSADGTHVIIGGTGGLGRFMAKHMIEHGARTIVLLSRSGGGKEKFEQLLAEVQQPDARIMVQKCDVTNDGQVRQFVNNCKGTLPPICGIIHSAMVLRVGSSLP